MPPIPIYSESPINAAKAHGVSPETAGPAPSFAPFTPTKTTASTTAAVQSPSVGYPAAQPGAAVPVPTGAAHLRYTPVKATPTQKLTDNGPPPPQPGAVPVPSSGQTSALPPPPRAGEAYQPPEQTPAPQQPQMPIPPQMSIPAPTTPHAHVRGTSTSTPGLGVLPGSPSIPTTASLGASHEEPLSHPPGYRQDANASEFTSNQRAAQNALSRRERSNSAFEGIGEDAGVVWTSAVKWAQAAGTKISEAEESIWRSINKEQ